MSKTLINTLLTICQREPSDYPSSKAFSGFCLEYGIGDIQGRRILLSPEDVLKVRMIITNQFGVDPSTPVDSWKDISRDEALSIGDDEKYSDQSVRDNRVAIKSLPGRPLLLDGREIYLPDRSSLDIGWQDAHRASGHDSVLLIENWTNFDKTNQTPLLESVVGNPLVVFRGSPVYRNDFAINLIRELKKPVVAFVDYDPYGIVIANSLPYFDSMLCPPIEELISLLKEAKNRDRFIAQKSNAQNVLNNINYKQLIELWRIFDNYGNALPQEKLIAN